MALSKPLHQKRFISRNESMESAVIEQMDAPASPESKLFAAVICLALAEAVSGCKQAIAAAHWIESAHEFGWYCAMVGIDPGWVRSRVGERVGGVA